MASARQIDFDTTLTAWDVDERDFPTGAAPSVKLEFLVRYAILAPSSHNSQPWLFRVRNETLELFADRSRALTVCDPDDRELTMSCGAALGHAATAARYFGYSPEVELLPLPANPDLLARLRLGDPARRDEAVNRRFAAIPKRRTTRTAFAANALGASELASFEALAKQNGIEMTSIVAPEARAAIAALVAEADKRQMGDPAFRAELASWVRRSSADSSDGMSLASFGIGDFLSPAAAAVLRTFDMGAGMAARDQQLAAGSPTMMLLWTHGDAATDWLRTGWALSDIMLEATARGLCTAFLNQPVELPDRRAALRGAAGIAGQPQLLLRLGRGPQLPPSARREAYRVIGA